MNDLLSFQVLLIGGSSGTGKTILARQLSQLWGIPALQMDDFRLVLEQVVQRAQQSRGGRSDLWDLVELTAIDETAQRYADPSTTADERFLALKDTAEVMSEAVEIVIAHHIATRTPIILEGDGILPALAIRRPVADLDPEPGTLRAVFLVEDDEAQLYAASVERGRGFEQHVQAEQRKIVRASWLYGQWIKLEAQRLAVPLLASRPWSTLVERVSQLVG